MYFVAYNTRQMAYQNMVVHWRSYERQCAYEKGIVCSVPVREIRPEQNIIPTTDRWKPG